MLSSPSFASRTDADEFRFALKQMRAHGHFVRPATSPGSFDVSDAGRMTMVELVRFARDRYGAWREDALLDMHGH